MFINVGQNKDHCGHEHETIRDAQKCLTEHQNECRKIGKISYRIIMEVDSIESLEDELDYY